MKASQVQVERGVGSNQVDRVEDFMMSLAQACPSSHLSQLVTEHLGTGGKRLRAQLALRGLEALGGDPSRAVPWAAACELLHNATLVHDDLQDQDRYRRGHETLWYRYGMAQAINAGDLMLMLPYLAIDALTVPEATKWQLSHAVARYAVALAGGQAQECRLFLEEQSEVLEKRYQEVCLGKTAALFELPVLGAALIGGLRVEKAQGLANEFSRLGLIFQMCDDVLDVLDKKGRFGAGEDIREGKVTCLIVEHLNRFPKERARLKEVFGLSRDQVQDKQVENLLNDYHQSGTLQAVLQKIHRLVREFHSSMVLREAPGLHREGCQMLEKILDPLPEEASP